jgi:cytochrome c oxidase cbb3-type subunit II
MSIFDNHTKLFGLATTLFIVLTIVVAIAPAISNQNNNAPLPDAEPLSGIALKGKEVFVSNGCVACHTQQVRNVEMDNVWGERPSIAADYSNHTRMSWWMNTATLMGTERTGPDLTNIGNRIASEDWHLVHLFNPRIVVEESIMPSYPWLFEIKDKADEGDKVVNVPVSLLRNVTDVVVANEEALQLVVYLQSLKQTPLPTGIAPEEFLYKKEKVENVVSAKTTSEVELDGSQLYAANCQACHQANGEGLKGAFPPLKGSKIVNSENPEVLINIIMNGYNAREEFAEMPAVGKLNNLTADEIAAIINHERSSWGNTGTAVSVKQVEEIIQYIDKQQTKPLNQ